MHDFLLAKEIIDELKTIILDKNLENIKRVNLEIGQVAMAHDGHPEHAEDISVENLEFGLESIARGTLLKNARFDIKKVPGNSWKIKNIETR